MSQIHSMLHTQSLVERIPNETQRVNERVSTEVRLDRPRPWNDTPQVAECRTCRSNRGRVLDKGRDTKPGEPVINHVYVSLLTYSSHGIES